LYEDHFGKEEGAVDRKMFPSAEKANSNQSIANNFLLTQNIWLSKKAKRPANISIGQSPMS
jgi:hypothetical protein